jgi:hypothetical protein
MKKAAGSAQLLRPYFPGKIECLCNGHFQPRLFTIIPEPALQVESQTSVPKRLLRERNVLPCWSGFIVLAVIERCVPPIAQLCQLNSAGYKVRGFFSGQEKRSRLQPYP